LPSHDISSIFAEGGVTSLNCS